MNKNFLMMLGVAGCMALTAPVVDADSKTTTVTTTTVTRSVSGEVPTASGGVVHNEPTFDINIKKTFQDNENVRGEVIVYNHGPAPVSDILHIRLYHNGKLHKEQDAALNQIMPGETRYTLDQLGISQINDDKSSQGDWSISIYDTDPALSKEADFRILSSI